MTARTSIPDHSTLGNYFITEGFVVESICEGMSMFLVASFGWGCWGGSSSCTLGLEVASSHSTGVILRNVALKTKAHNYAVVQCSHPFSLAA